MTDSEINAAISEYALYFTGVLCAIGRMSEFECRPVPILQQMLYLNVLDTFAGDAFPDCTNNGHRFVKFVDDISGWKHRNKVSATRLSSCLADRCHEKSKLYKKVCDHFVDDDIVKTIDDDYCACEFFLIADSECQKKIIDTCRFPWLVWKYRNFISHEFKIPSAAVDVKEFGWSTPRYLSTSMGRSLVFPTRFFADLCKMSLENFERWLRREQINPHDPARKKQVDDW